MLLALNHLHLTLMADNLMVSLVEQVVSIRPLTAIHLVTIVNLMFVAKLLVMEQLAVNMDYV